MIPASSAFITNNAALVKAPVFALEIEGYTRVFTNKDTGIIGHAPWIVSGGMGDHSLTVEDLEGSSSLGDLAITVLDYAQAITADLPSFVFEGKQAVLKCGYLGMDYADYCKLFTGKIYTVPTADNNNCYVFTAQDKRIDLKQVVFLDGDDGQPTSTDHPKTLNGHPLDLIEFIFTDQLGYTTADYDQTKLHAYRDSVFAGMNFEFRLTTAPEAKDFIEKQIMKPLGGYLWADSAGKVTVNFFTPLPGTTAPVLTIDPDLNTSPVPEIAQADLKNVVTVRMDKSEDKFLTETVQVDSISTAKYGQQGQQIIESDGLKSAFQGVSIAQQTAAAIFARYGDKNIQFPSLTALWSACRLDPGDPIYVTNPLIPDRDAGAMGLTLRRMEVLNRSWHLDPCTVELLLIDGNGQAVGGAFKIAPDGHAAWTASTADDKAKYMFIAGTDGKYSDATAGNKLG